MKTLILTSILMLSSLLNANAGGHDSIAADREVRRAIERHIQSPKAADGQSIYGAALIEFDINCQGEIELLAAEATSNELLKYVENKLRTLRIGRVTVGKTYTYRLIFKPEKAR